MSSRESVDTKFVDGMGVLSARDSGAEIGMDARSLVGVWKLVSFHLKDKEGNLTYPFGPDAVGYYVLTPSGYGSVSLMKKTRSVFNSGDIFGGTADEFMGAGKGYISYAGRYEVRGEELVLHAEVVFFPNWVGMDQIRFVSMKDDRLTLSSMPILASGKQQTAQLLWERVG